LSRGRRWRWAESLAVSASGGVDRITPLRLDGEANPEWIGLRRELTRSSDENKEFGEEGAWW
jgi:hypothetical protein